MIDLKFRRPFSGKIGLALGGGAVLGAAHIGVLRAFRESDLQIQAVAGTSIGALIASLYAFGVEPDEIANQAKNMNWLNVTSLTVSKLGLLSNDKIGKLVTDLVGDKNIEDAPSPLAMVATNISSGGHVILDKGPLDQAVCASTCIPGIFKPVEIEGRMLVDGGLVENVPVSPLERMGCRTIVGIDLNANREYQAPDDIVDVLLNAMDIAIDHSAQVQSREAELIIAPNLNAFSRTDAGAIDELIEEGFTAARAAIDEYFYL